MSKYILITKRKCDNEWEVFNSKNINKVKEKLKVYKGIYKYKVYKEIENGEFEISYEE